VLDPDLISVAVADRAELSVVHEEMGGTEIAP